MKIDMEAALLLEVGLYTGALRQDHHEKFRGEAVQQKLTVRSIFKQ